MSIHDTLHRPEHVIVTPIPGDVAEPMRHPARHAVGAPNRSTATTDQPIEATTGQRPFTISIPPGSFQGVRFVEGEHRPGFFGFVAAQ
jgi:hypothetical protein